MTDDMLATAARRSLAAAMSTEPRIVEAKANPEIARVRTLEQTARLFKERAS